MALFKKKEFIKFFSYIERITGQQMKQHQLDFSQHRYNFHGVLDELNQTLIELNYPNEIELFESIHR